MEFRRAERLDEALEFLAELGDEARVLAGGTDVMVQYLRGEISPAALLHIERIPELAAVSGNGRIAIGPLVTHRTLAKDQRIAAANPALATAAATIGGWQTQSMGTVGGNICNASPAADTAPPLLVADAHVTIASSGAERRVALTDFFVDRRRTLCGAGELVTGIDLEPLPANAAEIYIKLGRRGAMEVALVGLAVRLAFAADGSVETARIALCSVAPTPRRFPEAEAALRGSHLGPATVAAAGDELRMAVSPIDDARASASYRKRVLRGLLERAVLRCTEMAAS